MEGRLEYHGIIGHDGEWMLRELQAIHFPTDHIRVEEQIVRGKKTVGRHGSSAIRTWIERL